MLNFSDGKNVGIGTNVPTSKLSVMGDANKSLGGGSWGVFSDERLKTVMGDYEYGLSEGLKLQPIRYKYNEGNPLGLPADGEHVGFSAQEVQKVIPEAVSETPDGYRVLNNDPILWAMLNGIQKQQTLIELQQARIAGLEARLDALAHQLDEVIAR